MPPIRCPIVGLSFAGLPACTRGRGCEDRSKALVETVRSSPANAHHHAGCRSYSLADLEPTGTMVDPRRVAAWEDDVCGAIWYNGGVVPVCEVARAAILERITAGGVQGVSV